MVLGEPFREKRDVGLDGERMKKLIWWALGIAAIFMVPEISVYANEKEPVALEGIYIDDTDVSGMTKQEVEKAIADSFQLKMKQPIHFICVDNQEVTVSPEEMGMTLANKELAEEVMAIGRKGDVVTRYKMKKDYQREKVVFHTEVNFDRRKIQAILEEQCKKFDLHAKNYSLKRVDGTFQVIKGTEGQVMDDETAFSSVYDFMTEEWDGKEAKISLPIVVENPIGSEEELADVTDLLGSFSTSCKTSSAARVANIQNGCNLINGITLYPGQEYSTLAVVTPFTEAHGYHMAGSYLNGMVVDSLGGGICQVSTTLYNAVLRAELEVTKRANHSMCVSYVPLSADAAIAESAGKDFCFRNNLEYPIYIEGFVTPERVITFNIYGKETRNPGRSVAFVSEVLQTIAPGAESIVQASSQPVGFAKVQSAHVGYKARLVKVVYQDGVEVSRGTANQSNYKMVPRILTVGTATAIPEHANQLQAAIATGNIDHVVGVAAALGAAEQAMAPAPAPAPVQ